MGQIQLKATPTTLGQTWSSPMFCRSLGLLLAMSCVCFLAPTELASSASQTHESHAGDEGQASRGGFRDGLH